MSEAKWLRKAAEEIRAENHAGWGNTCEQAAEYIERLEVELERLRETATDLINAEIDRWAAGTDRQSAEANAAHEKAHDALAALLDKESKSE